MFWEFFKWFFIIIKGELEVVVLIVNYLNCFLYFFIGYVKSYKCILRFFVMYFKDGIVM